MAAPRIDRSDSQRSCASGKCAGKRLRALNRPALPTRLPQEGCHDCTQQWHRFEHSTGRLVALLQHSCRVSALRDAPPAAGEAGGQPLPLPGEFAGIGTRSLGAAGRQAIRQLLRNTYSSADGHSTGKELS